MIPWEDDDGSNPEDDRADAPAWGCAFAGWIAIGVGIVLAWMILAP